MLVGLVLRADLGGSGGVGGRLSPFRDSTPCRSPLCTILIYPFLATDPKNVLKAPSAPIYASFEGVALAFFWPVFFQKFFGPSTFFGMFLASFFGLFFFSKFCQRRRKFGQKKGQNSALGELENQFGRPKKKSTLH